MVVVKGLLLLVLVQLPVLVRLLRRILGVVQLHLLRDYKKLKSGSRFVAVLRLVRPVVVVIVAVRQLAVYLSLRFCALGAVLFKSNGDTLWPPNAVTHRRDVGVNVWLAVAVKVPLVAIGRAVKVRFRKPDGRVFRRLFPLIIVGPIIVSIHTGNINEDESDRVSSRV